MEDVRTLIPSLIAREGLKAWSPQPSSWSNADGPARTWHSWGEYTKSYEEVGRSTMGSKQQLKDKLGETMFPPKNVDDLHLDWW